MFYPVLELFTVYCCCNLDEGIFLLKELLIYTDMLSANGLSFTLLIIQGRHLANVYCWLYYRIILWGLICKIFNAWCLAVTSGRDTEKCTCLHIFPSMGHPPTPPPPIRFLGEGMSPSLRKKIIKIYQMMWKKIWEVQKCHLFGSKGGGLQFKSLTLRSYGKLNLGILQPKGYCRPWLNAKP